MKNLKGMRLLYVFILLSCVLTFLLGIGSFYNSFIMYCNICSKGNMEFEFSKTKKVLLIIAQLTCCFILYVIWFLIWLVTFTDGIRFGE